MAKIKVRNEKCLCCRHFGFCLIPWGAECKRQGGKKIPSMKSLPLKLLPRAKKKQDRPNNKIINMYGLIRTKKINWG